MNNVSMATGCSWLDNNIIAYSTWWYWTGGDSACCIFEGDVCFNDNVTWYNDSGLCSGNCWDLLSVAIHELGHWIASGHENDIGIIGYKPVMYYQFNYCEQRRTITADDSALVRWAYDWLSVITLADRCDLAHKHPPYPPRPPQESCLETMFTDAVVCEPQGGANPTHPPTYWYDVTPGAAGRCDFHVKVHDSVAGHYTNWVEPLNWTHQLHKVGNDWYVSWWSPGCANPIWNTFRFKFDNSNASGWGHWTTTVDATSNPFAQVMDLSANHTAGTDGYGYRVHGPTAGCCNHDGIRGDCNYDGKLNVSDLTYLVSYLFKGGPAPPCSEESDANGDGKVNVSDLTYLVSYLFKGGAAPVACP